MSKEMNMTITDFVTEKGGFVNPEKITLFNRKVKI